MNVRQVKSLGKRATIVVGAIAGFVGLVAVLSYFLEQDRLADQSELCAPATLEHTFLYEHRHHAVCQRADGSLFVSEKSKK